MRFLLYNIRYGAGIGKKFHFPFPYVGFLKRTNGHFSNIIDFITAVNPDVAGLIEVDGGSYRTEKQHQAVTIANQLNHQSIYQPKYADDSIIRKIPVLNKQGNALLTNRTIKNQRFHYFKDGVKRLAIELELDTCIVFLVHLSLKYRHRQSQLRELHSLITNVNKPVIVAGDFNVFWGEKELHLFLAATGLKSANGNGYPSHPSRSPRRQLDYIFHSSDITTKQFTIPQVKYSDHMPLVCDFEIGATSLPS